MDDSEPTDEQLEQRRDAVELGDTDTARESDEAFQALQRILTHAEQHGEAYPGAVRDVELVRERIGK